MTICASPGCSERSSEVVFQTFHFPKTGRLQDTFHIQYHFKFEHGDTSNGYPFFNAFYCNESNGNLKRSQTYQWKRIITNNNCDKWFQMDLNVINTCVVNRRGQKTFPYNHYTHENSFKIIGINWRSANH